MKNLRIGRLQRNTLKKIILSIGLGIVCCGPASAQTPASATEQQPSAAAPLNLDSADVAKEMSKGQHPDDVKPEVFSAAQSAFELSILNSESRKKVSGIVEVGAGVGTLPENRWHKAENVNCENAAVAVTDQISNTAQIGLSAQVDTCHLK
jgi:hypothetical protein